MSAIEWAIGAILVALAGAVWQWGLVALYVFLFLVTAIVAALWWPWLRDRRGD
jgi:hypothetical protein